MRSLAVSRDADGVVQVEMTRPLMDAPMIGELADTFESLGDSPEAKAIVLSGQGAVFSTGVDLRRVMRANQGRAEWSVADARAFARMLWLIESCPKPTIARVHGAVAGGGIGLVCACQFVVASDDASFAAIETAFGDIPAVIRPYLVSTVGKQQAQRLASSSTRVDAHQARTIGLVQTVVSRSELDAAAKALATFLGTVPMRQII